MRQFTAYSVVSLALLSAWALPRPAVRADDPVPIRGFSADAVRVQREWEAKFKAIPDPARMREAMRHLTARPRHVGAPYTRETAEWMAEQFRSWGWQARVETFEVLFPTPKERVVELVAPTRWAAKLREPAVEGDPTSAQHDEQLPTYNAYSIDGDVTAPLVYVNYGMPVDYEELERRGISVKGAIVIARYGAGWRGIKPKVAAEHGAVGALIYSDPADDGYVQGDVYPKGPYRNSDGVQRGSVADMPTYPGDPLTPFVGATKNAKRLTRAQATTLTKIPVLPISYGDAQPLLAALAGPTVPEKWRGGLPITYHFGPGPARVHLKLAFNWDIKPIHNVIATLPGTERPDEWVVRGNHHDAWVNGAEDPISGLVPELEEARAMGELYKQGWRPRRTIVYAAWDGEEPGLLGSTEWVEAHREELERKAVAYLNTDSNGRGYLDLAGSHTLEQFLNEVARDVTDPQSGVSVWKRRQLSQIRYGEPEARKEARTRRDLRLDALGSGSDFTPFLQHAGIPTLNVGFYGEDNGGIYHSIYDDFRWYTSFSDTSFVYGRALAQTVGIAVMRLASAELLPHEFTALADAATRYAGELEKLRDTHAEEAEERARQLDEGLFRATDDPRAPTREPARLAVPPHFAFTPVRNALDSLTRSAARYDRAYAAALASGTAFRAAADSVNPRLRASERALMSPDGLPKRPWFRHLLYAPGYYTGYGVKTMPAAREAIEQRQYGDVDPQLARIAKALAAEAKLAAEAAAVLERAVGKVAGR